MLKILLKVLLGISQSFYYYTSYYACILLQYEQHRYKILLLECSIRVFMTQK